MDGFVADALSVDEAGIGTARYGGVVLRSAYQPVFRHLSDRLLPFAMEALIRPWQNGAIAPVDFFAGVARCDAVRVEALCHAVHLRNFRHVSRPGLRLFLNVGPVHDADPEAVSDWLVQMARQLEELGIDRSLLICEVGEAEGFATRRLLALLRSLGFSIAVDKFGAGASAMDWIALARPDIVKIDGFFFRRVASEAAAMRLLPPLFRGLHDLGCEVAVEGIETQIQLELAIEAGADMAQGHLLGPPMLAGMVQDVEVRPVRPPDSIGANVTLLFARR